MGGWIDWRIHSERWSVQPHTYYDLLVYIFYGLCSGRPPFPPDPDRIIKIAVLFEQVNSSYKVEERHREYFKNYARDNSYISRYKEGAGYAQDKHSIENGSGDIYEWQRPYARGEIDILGTPGTETYYLGLSPGYPDYCRVGKFVPERPDKQDEEDECERIDPQN